MKKVTNKNTKNKTCSDYIVVKKDSGVKGFFDIIMLFVSCYNILGNIYYATFGERKELWVKILNWSTEILFLIDMGFNFT